MSLILDALSRAERDKRAGETAAPDILSQQPAGPAPLARRWPAIVLGFVVVVLGTIGVYVLLKPSQPVQPVAATDKPGDAAKASPPQPTLISKPRPVIAPEASVPAPAPEVAALYAESSGRVEQSDSDDIASADPSGAPAPVPAAPPESIDIERVLRRVRSEYPRDEVTEHPVPLLETLSQQFRDSVPTLMYMQHDYSAMGQSSVLLNGQTLVSGQRTRGVEVLEILNDSVVLRFGETEFRLRSLNSWVNL